jgi:uroporphyrinogen decarboxylase
MSAAARKWRDLYACKPGAPFVQREFGFYSVEAWAEQGLPVDADYAQEFGYDPPGRCSLGALGWVVAEFHPTFEEEVLEVRGKHEVVRDRAGRHVLVFKGRRSGFMPEYLDHPVKDWATWERDVKWRLDPDAPGRFDYLDEKIAAVSPLVAEGQMLTQHLIGGYMYLRSLMGPESVLYMVYDEPDLIRDCMETWFRLADTVIARHQEHVTLDELFLAEDICYNHGPLISPDMMREFLWPYYQQLITNVKARQIDPARHLFIHVDTDGFSDPVIPVYQELGLDALSPFEVASGCDVVRTGREFPGLVIQGGVDKRVLAQDKAAIDRHLAAILPVMYERGGYCPTCDHGVPAEVSLENYRHYRKRVLEYA